MHPVESMARSKRSDVGAQMLMNDYNDEMSSVFWQSRAQHTLRDQLKKEQNHNVAKNIILFLGNILHFRNLIKILIEVKLDFIR